MFTEEELSAIDTKYFAVIMANEFDVTLMSKNTKHVWYMHSVDLPDRNLVIMFHKHHATRSSRIFVSGYY